MRERTYRDHPLGGGADRKGLRLRRGTLTAEDLLTSLLQ